VACRQTKAKQELIRVVRVLDGSVEIDLGGKKAGRGAYLCPAQGCWQAILSGGRLEHTLRTPLTKDNRAQLVEAAARLGFGR